MRKSRHVIMFSFLLIFILCLDLNASGIYIGPQLGYSMQKPSLKDVEFSTDTTFLYGLRAGLKILVFGVELNYFQAAHNLEFKVLVTFAWGGREVDYNYLGLNFKYYFPVLILQPHLIFGLGYYTADVFEIDKDTSMGFNLGLGLEVKLGKRFSLLAEVKYHHATLRIDEQELKIGDFTLGGGFNFFF